MSIRGRAAGDQDRRARDQPAQMLYHRLRGLRGAKLLDEVWGDHVFVEERTVDVHIRRLREALSPTGHAGLIETVRGAGYRFKRALN